MKSGLAPQYQELHEILGSNDPFDDPNFDPVKFMNEQFPDDLSLHDIDVFMDSMHQKMHDLDVDIEVSIRNQAKAQQSAKIDLTKTKDTIHRLCDDLRQMRFKVKAADALVKEICRDVRSLDYGKRNMSGTISALELLVDFVSKLDKLRESATHRNYKGCIPLVTDCEALSNYFLSLAATTPRISELVTMKENIFLELCSQIDEDFEALVSDNTIPADENGDVADLISACRIVDCIDSNVRSSILSKTCMRILDPYRRLFGPGEEAATLPNIERRFAWLRRALSDYDEKLAAYFSPYWQVSAAISEQFCQISRVQLVAVLGSSDHSSDPNTISKGLHRCHEFEEATQQRLSNQASSLKASIPPPPTSALTSRLPANTLVDKNGKMRYTSPIISVPRIMGVVTDAFSAYLGPWLSTEENNLLDTVSSACGNDQIFTDHMSHGELRRVFSSAAEVFQAISVSVRKIHKVSRGAATSAALLGIRRVLSRYADVLNGRISTRGAKSSGGLPPEEVQKVAAVGGTACYAIDTLGEMSQLLEELENETIEMCKAVGTNVLSDSNREFGANTFEAEKEMFINLRSNSVQCLLNSTLNQMETSVFSHMLRVNCGPNAPDVIGESSFISDGALVAEAACLAAIQELPPILFRFWADRLAVEMMTRHQEVVGTLIHNYRKVSEEGAQQLFIDAVGLRGGLQRAHLSALEWRFKTPAGDEKGDVDGEVGGRKLNKKVILQQEAFVKVVNRSSEKLDMILKKLSAGLDADDLLTSNKNTSSSNEHNQRQPMSPSRLNNNIPNRQNIPRGQNQLKQDGFSNRTQSNHLPVLNTPGQQSPLNTNRTQNTSNYVNSNNNGNVVVDNNNPNMNVLEEKKNTLISGLTSVGEKLKEGNTAMGRWFNRLQKGE